MSLRPNPQSDGPIVVHWTDGDVQHYDNCWHTKGGMITLTAEFVGSGEPTHSFNDSTDSLKDDPARAVSVPRERIERIEYSTYGLNDDAGE